jgi:cytochrome d ubiquinol oxidase subunit II
MSEYEILRLIWWALLGILLIGFAVMDGFDLGTAALLPFVGRTDKERRVAINSIGPVWEGNQVWFIVGGGSIFAAWPMLYAASFSGFYLAMFLVLATLILRPVGFKFRGQIDNARWRAFWDWCLFAGGIVPALVFGVAFGNLFLGVPFSFDETLRMRSQITLLGLLNPFSLLVGLVSLAMIVLHGASWLNYKTRGRVQDRARAAMPWLAGAFVIAFALAGLWLAQKSGYRIAGAMAHDGPSNPLLKHVARGSWLRNYHAMPLLWLAPICAFAGAGLAILLRARPLPAFFCTGLAVAATIATAGAALFPFLLPSSTVPDASLTVWDASSSRLTLAVMLGATALTLPVVVLYTGWVYRVLRGPVSEESLETDGHSY